MSEFEHCGELMSRSIKTGKLTCRVCGGTNPQYMDGKSRRELAAEERDPEIWREKKEEDDDTE